MSPPVPIAVVDDSSFLRKAVARMLAEEPGIELVGLAASGEELLAHLDEWRPEVVTLDLSMPGMGGLSTLDHLGERPDPPRVIVLSTHTGKDAPLTFEALARGAIDFIDKQSYSLVDFDALRRVLVEKILLVAGRAGPAPAPPPGAAVPELPRRRPARTTGGPFDLVAIGASTGGPPAIERVLRDLGSSPPVPIVIVQHMPAGFTRAFAERLNAYLPFEVREAADGEALAAGTAVIAPGGSHLTVRRRRGRLETVLDDRPDRHAHRPSVDLLLDSVERTVGAHALAVLLTGMGSDGAAGLKRLAGAGAHTIAQDEKSSALWGMPRAAVAAGAVREVLPLGRIGGRLSRLLAERGNEHEPERGKPVDPKKILVVEDSELLHKVYGAILRKREVIHARNGQEALQRLAEQPDTDLVLLDINMPTMNGLEFLRRVKDDEALAEIPVVIVSTETQDEDILRGLEQGASAYIKKPFKDHEILDIIERL